MLPFFIADTNLVFNGAEVETDIKRFERVK